MNFAPDCQIIKIFNDVLNKSEIPLRVGQVELNSMIPDLDFMPLEEGTNTIMDTRFAPFLREIQKGDFDVIIPMEQVAIDLLSRYSDSIPEKTAIVFCGFNVSAIDLIQKHKNTTGVSDHVSVKNNVELGLQIFPQTKKIILLSNWSSQGSRITDDAKRCWSEHPA